MRRLIPAALIIACLSVTACGWHLQGSAHLPAAFAVTGIEADDAYTDFYRELRRSLVASGSEIGVAPRARAVVHVRADLAGQRVAAVSPRNTPEEFQVFYAVDYSVLIDGAEVAANEHLELTANYSYDPTAVLAKQREQRTIQQALARELASIVLRKLATVSARSE